MRLKKYAIGSAVLLLIILLFVFYGGRFLVYDEPPRKADVIVVLSGDKGERTVKGAELFREKYAPYLLVSGGIVYHKTTMAELMKEHAIELGVPEDSILVEDKADSTYENAVFTLDILKRKDFHSAIIVSSNYHMRRVKLLFDREFRDSGISLTYVAAADDQFRPTRWWSSNKSIMITLTEYIKFFGYLLGKNG